MIKNRTIAAAAVAAALCLVSACGRQADTADTADAENTENTEAHSTAGSVESKEENKMKKNEITDPEKKAETTESSWVKTEALNLEIKPVKAFAEDWMALCVGSAKNMNAMTISWGTIGQLWNKNVVTVYVSSDRYSKKMMDSAKYFTVVGFPESKENRNALIYLGSHSRKDVKNKIEESGLNVEFTELGNPVFSEGNLVFECRKIYESPFEMERVPDDVKDRMYSGENAIGIHTMYIGEIVNIWQK